MITDNNKQHYLFVKKIKCKNKNNHPLNYSCINCLKKFTTTLGLKKLCQENC